MITHIDFERIAEETAFTNLENTLDIIEFMNIPVSIEKQQFLEEIYGQEALRDLVPKKVLDLVDDIINHIWQKIQGHKKIEKTIYGQVIKNLSIIEAMNIRSVTDVNQIITTLTDINKVMPLMFALFEQTYKEWKNNGKKRNGFIKRADLLAKVTDIIKSSKTLRLTPDGHSVMAEKPHMMQNVTVKSAGITASNLTTVWKTMLEVSLDAYEKRTKALISDLQQILSNKETTVVGGRTVSLELRLVLKILKRHKEWYNKGVDLFTTLQKKLPKLSTEEVHDGRASITLDENRPIMSLGEAVGGEENVSIGTEAFKSDPNVQLLLVTYKNKEDLVPYYKKLLYYIKLQEQQFSKLHPWAKSWENLSQYSSKKDILRDIVSNRGWYILLIKENELIGYISYEPNKLGRSGEIKTLFIDPKTRNYGYGRMLYLRLLEQIHVSQPNCKIITLVAANGSSTTRNLYLSVGFKPYAELMVNQLS